MYRLKHMFVWLRRFSHLGGNGIQSPFVYDFVCQVVNNHSAYYAYHDLRHELRHMSLRQRRLAKLLFRLANFVQPARILVHPEAMTYAPFLKKGCAKASLQPLEPEEPGNDATPNSPTMLIVKTAQEVPANLSPGSLAVVLNIHTPQTCATQWHRLCAAPWATLTFDLYDLGIIMIAPKRYKQQYIINF